MEVKCHLLLSLPATRLNMKMCFDAALFREGDKLLKTTEDQRFWIEKNSQLCLWLHRALIFRDVLCPWQLYKACRVPAYEETLQEFPPWKLWTCTCTGRRVFILTRVGTRVGKFLFLPKDIWLKMPKNVLKPIPSPRNFSLVVKKIFPGE